MMLTGVSVKAEMVTRFPLVSSKNAGKSMYTYITNKKRKINNFIHDILRASSKLVLSVHFQTLMIDLRINNQGDLLWYKSGYKLEQKHFKKLHYQLSNKWNDKTGPVSFE